MTSLIKNQAMFRFTSPSICGRHLTCVNNSPVCAHSNYSQAARNEQNRTAPIHVQPLLMTIRQNTFIERINKIGNILSNYRLISCRAFSSDSTSDGSPDKNQSSNTNTNVEQEPEAANQKLPRRILKRLQKQGISETDYLTKLNTFGASSDLYENYDMFAAKYGKKEKLEEILKNMSTEPDDHPEADSFPSDMKRYKLWKQQQESKSDSEHKVEASTTSVILFPGQGSQFPGMGQQLLRFPGVRELYEEASSVLGYDLLELCLKGPESELNKTVYCQPAVMVTSLACLEKCREEHPRAIDSCVATAGFSVGEYAALVFSGVLSFPDAVQLVKVRAEAMQKASEEIGSGMLTVFLAHDSDLKGAIKMAQDYCIQRRNIEKPVCTVANYLFPECKVLAGHHEALEFIATNAKSFNILRTKRLAVSGAFHTNLMETAVEPLKKAMEGLKIGRPKVNVYSNVTSHPYHAKANFPYMLAQQLVKPVKWEQILHEIYSRQQGLEFPHTYEVGPGRQMGTLLKQVNMQAHKQYHNVDV